MEKNIKRKVVKKLIILSIIFLISFFIALFVREQYPLLRLDKDLINITQEEGHLIIRVPISEDDVTFTGQYEGTKKCMTFYTNVLIDNTRINEGDLFVVNTFWDCWFCSEELYAGISEKELLKVKPNFWGQEIGRMYYKNDMNKIYTKFCFDLNNINRAHTVRFEVNRPYMDSFKASLSTFILVFGFLIGVIKFILPFESLKVF